MTAKFISLTVEFNFKGSPDLTDSFIIVGYLEYHKIDYNKEDSNVIRVSLTFDQFKYLTRFMDHNNMNLPIKNFMSFGE